MMTGWAGWPDAAVLRKIEAGHNVIATLAQLTTPSKHSRLPDDPVTGLAHLWEDLLLAGFSHVPLRLGRWPFLHARLPASGLAIFTAIVVAGCGGGSSTPTSSASSSPPAGQLTSGVSKCLKKHGVNLPSGPPGAGSGQPPSGGTPPSGGAPPSGAHPRAGTWAAWPRHSKPAASASPRALARAADSWSHQTAADMTSVLAACYRCRIHWSPVTHPLKSRDIRCPKAL